MSLINWSDPDEMLGLLAEYTADEAIASGDDPDRSEFLNALAADLENLASQETRPAEEIARALIEIRDLQAREFLHDPVITHLDACIEELHRIAAVR